MRSKQSLRYPSKVSFYTSVLGVMSPTGPGGAVNECARAGDGKRVRHHGHCAKLERAHQVLPHGDGVHCEQTSQYLKENKNQDFHVKSSIFLNASY